MAAVRNVVIFKDAAPKRLHTLKQMALYSYNTGNEELSQWVKEIEK